MPEYKHLTLEEREHFVQHGWVKFENAIAPRYLREWMENMWVRLGMDPQNKSTWTEEYTKLPRHREARCEEVCPEAWAKMCEIVGGEDKIDPVRERHYGDQLIVNFGTEELVSKSHTMADLNGWHTDNDWYRQFLDSSGNALTVILCFTDVLPNGGGTCLAEDAINPFCEHLYNHPEGLDPPFESVFKFCTDAKVVTEVTAKAGDVLVTHGMLPHCPSPNHLHYARVITNPHVNMREPFNLNRADGDYTLCEQVILRALGRDAVPEYVPTRERITFYPRTAYFKREKVKAELERMLADAEKRGLPPSSVDSVYLQGEEAIAQHERNNGYDKAWGPNGVIQSIANAGVKYIPPTAKHVLV